MVWFGVNVPIYKETAHELSDAPYCIHCKTEYEYDYITYGHLGGFRCPKCGYHRHMPDVAVTKVVSTGADSSDVVLDIFGREHEVHVNLPGGYNIYNAAAAAAVSHVSVLTRRPRSVRSASLSAALAARNSLRSVRHRRA